MEKLNYKIIVPGARILTTKWGEVTEKNLTNEIAKYLLATGAYNHIIEEIKSETDGSKKSTGKVH